MYSDTLFMHMTVYGTHICHYFSEFQCAKKAF